MLKAIGYEFVDGLVGVATARAYSSTKFCPGVSGSQLPS